jgi:hypothetical protein
MSSGALAGGLAKRWECTAPRPGRQELFRFCWRNKVSVKSKVRTKDMCVNVLSDFIYCPFMRGEASLKVVGAALRIIRDEERERRNHERDGEDEPLARRAQSEPLSRRQLRAASRRDAEQLFVRQSVAAGNLRQQLLVELLKNMMAHRFPFSN